MNRITDHPVATPFRFYRLLGRDFLLPFAGLLLLDILAVVPMTNAHWVSLGGGIALTILPKLVVVPWAGTRLLRIAEMHFERFGASGVKLTLLGALLTMVLILLVTTIESIQTMLFTRSEQVRVWSTPEVNYRFRYHKADGQYTIEGEIDFGITRDFRAFLSQHPGGHLLILNSRGGSIYEGRGLFQVISDYELDTHVEDECLSACVLAFLGGGLRTLATEAELGFHQYAVDYSRLNQSIPFYDPEHEQEKDVTLMRQLGIREEFLQRAFQQPHGSIWTPTHKVLIDAGVIHPGTQL